MKIHKVLNVALSVMFETIAGINISRAPSNESDVPGGVVFRSMVSFQAQRSPTVQCRNSKHHWLASIVDSSMPGREEEEENEIIASSDEDEQESPEDYCKGELITN